MKSFLVKYIKGIEHIQNLLTILSLGVFLLILPLFYAFDSNQSLENTQTLLYFISFAAVTFVMAIRPLADIFKRIVWIRALVVLRKSFGILSASIIVCFMLYKLIVFGPEYLNSLFKSEAWQFADYGVLARLGDFSAVILLITSNIFSKKILGKNWKRIQKLAYVYFYSGGLYEFLVYKNLFALYSMIIISFLVILAFFINKIDKESKELKV